MTWALAAAMSSGEDGDSEVATPPRAVAPDSALSDSGPFPNARRQFATHARLLPADRSTESFLKWLDDLGFGDLPSDDIAELRVSICRLAGWPLPSADAPRKRRAAPERPKPTPTVEIAPPPAKVAPPAVAAAAPFTFTFAKPDTLTAIPNRSGMDSTRSAERFLEWLRFAGHSGKHTSEALSRLYAQHCAAENIMPIAEATLRKGLSQIGVRKSTIEAPVKGGRGRSYRFRPTVWVIEPLATVTGDIPWEPLPDRRASAA